MIMFIIKMSQSICIGTVGVFLDQSNIIDPPFWQLVLLETGVQCGNKAAVGYNNSKHFFLIWLALLQC
jgi:hypothetical protein